MIPFLKLHSTQLAGTRHDRPDFFDSWDRSLLRDVGWLYNWREMIHLVCRKSIGRMNPTRRKMDISVRPAPGRTEISVLRANQHRPIA
jgi:hypothetical protein